LHVTASERPEIFYETFFSGDLGGVIITQQGLGSHDGPNLVGGGVASILKSAGEVTYVRPMLTCQVRVLERVFSTLELATHLAHELAEDERKPILDEYANWGAPIISEAELVLPKTYCIG
jgi:hypothetical protein